MAGFDRIRQTDNQILAASKSIHTLHTIQYIQYNVVLVTKCSMFSESKILYNFVLTCYFYHFIEIY